MATCVLLLLFICCMKRKQKYVGWIGRCNYEVNNKTRLIKLMMYFKEDDRGKYSDLELEIISKRYCCYLVDEDFVARDDERYKVLVACGYV